MYQYLLNVDDVSAPASLRFFTFLSHEEILALDEATRTSSRTLGPAALAREVLTWCTARTPLTRRAGERSSLQ